MEIPFFKPEIDEATIADVAAVLRSGWLTTGPKTAEFEEKFAAYVGARHAVFMNSGTAALHVSLAAIDLKPGDEVIMCPYTFAATAEVVEYFDARPVFVDCRPDTFNLDERRIEEKITPRTRAIMPVHIAGHPCEMDAIAALARARGLKVFEDAAHCTPAYFRGKPVGALCDATSFSFYANKCITTGEGGMLTTDDDGFADRARRLRLHGLSKDAAGRYGKKGSWRYDIVDRGYKYNPTDIAAAIGLGQLKQSERFWAERRRVVSRYRAALSSDPRLLNPVELPHVQSSWHIYLVRLQGRAAEHRDRVIDALKDRGITVSVHFIPLHLHSYYRNKYGYQPQDFPETSKAFAGVISLPVYPALTDEKVDYVARNLREVLDAM